MAIEVNYEHQSPDKGSTEVVERKGLGHPDTLADGIAESAAIEYEKYCREQFGVIPHHNFDKASILGGLCVQEYGGGVFTAPIKMLFMGRGSMSFAGEDIPLRDIQMETAKKYIARILPSLDTANSDMYTADSTTSAYSTRPFWFNPRGIEDLPEYADQNLRANDTATMISYWPLTPTEKMTLALEGYFYENNEVGLPKPRLDYIGQDIKVMSVRSGSDLSVTMAVPQITYQTPDLRTYMERLRVLEDVMQAIADEMVGDGLNVSLKVNTQQQTANRPYLVTGGSCTDFGEEGAVGRGNKTHGIISSFRPNTMEAPHGKNPTYFVGKVLGYQADVIAREVSEKLDVKCQVIVQANIGDDLFDPKVIVSTDKRVSSDEVKAIVEQSLSAGRDTTNRIIDDAYFVPQAHIVDGV